MYALRGMIEEFLLHPLFKENGHFLWLARVRDIWEERNDRVFRDTNRDPCEVWSLVRFHVFLGASDRKSVV